MNRFTPSPASVTCRRSPEVSSTAFDAQPPDLPPVSLMDMGFAIIGPLARHRRPQIRFLFIGSRLCSALLSGPASRRVLFHPCASLSLHVHHVVKVRRRRPQIQFLSIGPYLCSTLPLDPTSRWCPCASLPFTSIRLGRDFHPLAAEHARRTTKRAADFSAARRHSQNYLFSLTRHDLPESARIYRDFSRSRRRVVRVTRSVRPRGS